MGKILKNESFDFLVEYYLKNKRSMTAYDFIKLHHDHGNESYYCLFVDAVVNRQGLTDDDKKEEQVYTSPVRSFKINPEIPVKDPSGRTMGFMTPEVEVPSFQKEFKRFIDEASQKADEMFRRVIRSYLQVDILDLSYIGERFELIHAFTDGTRCLVDKQDGTVLLKIIQTTDYWSAPFKVSCKEEYIYNEEVFETDSFGLLKLKTKGETIKLKDNG